MNKNEFIALLRSKGIDAGIVSFDSNTNEGYNIRKNNIICLHQVLLLLVVVHGWIINPHGQEVDMFGLELI